MGHLTFLSKGLSAVENKRISQFFASAREPRSRVIALVELACVASVSVEFGSKERPRNGVFGILPTRKMGREPKKERWG